MPIWIADDPLILASKSKARQTLLTAAGIPIEVCPAELDERALEAGAGSAQPGVIAGLLAREKAAVVARAHRGRLVAGADQILALGSRPFAKPADRAAARAQLCVLSGTTHELYSAVAFVQDATVLFEHVSTARLTMRAFSDQFLDHYLDGVGNAVTESVGAYQLESLGIQLFERVEGDYFTVLGLPLLEALGFLRRLGYLVQ